MENLLINNLSLSKLTLKEEAFVNRAIKVYHLSESMRSQAIVKLPSVKSGFIQLIIVSRLRAYNASVFEPAILPSTDVIDHFTFLL